MSTSDPARRFPAGEVSRPGNQPPPVMVLRTPDPTTTISNSTLIEVSQTLG
jgi:hypothetical protein